MLIQTATRGGCGTSGHGATRLAGGLARRSELPARCFHGPIDPDSEVI